MQSLRTKECPECNRPFSYQIGQGNDRKYCGTACREVAKKRFRLQRHENAPMCPTGECNGRATRITSGLCETCYYRIRRNGTTDRRRPAYRYVTRFGYIKLKDASHPLADSGGLVFEHRKVVYDLVGNNVPPCYWCQTPLTWHVAVVDHLNEIKDDNTPSNLVVACNDCNRARGAMMPFISAMTEARFERLVDVLREYRDR